MNKWDPHVLVDLHTTNGSYHAYHLTYSPILNPNADPRLIEFTKSRMLTPIRQAMLKTHNWRTYDYGNFAPEDGGGRESSRVDPANPGNVTWRTFDHRPRFGNNYAGLRNRIAILSEAYSYLDFKGRIDVTEHFVEEIYRSVQANAKQIMSLTAQADRMFTAPASAKPVELGVDFSISLVRRQGRDPGRRRDQGAESAIGPRDARHGAVGGAGADEGVCDLHRHALAVDAEGLADSEDTRDSARTGRRARSPALAWHQDSGIGETTSSWRSSGSRSPTSPRRRRPFQGHQEARLKGTFDKAQLTVACGLAVHSRQPAAGAAGVLPARAGK